MIADGGNKTTNQTSEFFLENLGKILYSGDIRSEEENKEKNMNTYRNTSPEWGAGCQATLADYEALANMYQQEEVKPELLTADEKHVYYDGKPIADRVPSKNEWQCSRCGDVFDKYDREGVKVGTDDRLCGECAMDCGCGPAYRNQFTKSA
jgi:hypothetical protein